MGRIKTTSIKRAAKKIFRDHHDILTKDFNTNKKIVEDLIEVQSKKIRNIIAGYTVKLKK